MPSIKTITETILALDVNNPQHQGGLKVMVEYLIQNLHDYGGHIASWLMPLTTRMDLDAEGCVVLSVNNAYWLVVSASDGHVERYSFEAAQEAGLI